MPLVKAAGPALPAISAILVELLRFNLIEPSPLILTTLTVTLLPLLADTLAIVPTALPVALRVKSSVEILLTDSSKFIMKSIPAAVATGEPLTPILVTTGVMVSMVTLKPTDAMLTLPAASVAVAVML